MSLKVALCGQVRAGKDTVAEYIVANYHMVPFAFADELKRGFHAEFPDKPRLPKPVKGYQLYGQLMRYVYGENYWVTLCLNKILDMQLIAEHYNITGDQIQFMPIITDLRQPNEFKRLKKEGYTIIRVEANFALRKERMIAAGDEFDESVFNFETEQHVMDMPVDHVIYNNSSVDELYRQIDSIMSVHIK